MAQMILIILEIEELELWESSLANQFSIALSRMFRTIRERMSQREAESLTPQDLINSRIITTVLNTFFGTSQLSQFMDQTNPLAEIT